MITLGDVPFLNSKPLFYLLKNGHINSSIEIVSYPPNILSKLLREKKIDMGLVPVIELLTRGGYKVVPDVSISSFGKVDSVVLVSNRELKDIRSVALDRYSLSSAGLIRVLFKNFLNMDVEFTTRSYNEHFFTDVDSGMLIGDTGLKILYTTKNRYKIYDLGDMWTNFTGLPFVYALLAVNDRIKLGNQLNNVIISKKEGVNFIEEICENESERIGISKEFCINYIKNRIGYDLNEEEIKGISEFAQCLNKIGIETKFNKPDIYKN